jgi:hypothetical protein
MVGKNFNSLVSSPDVVKDVLRGVGGVAIINHHKSFIRSIFNGVVPNIMPGQAVISVMFTAGYAYTNDLVDYIYKEYGITAKYFPDES